MYLIRWTRQNRGRPETLTGGSRFATEAEAWRQANIFKGHFPQNMYFVEFLFFGRRTS